MIQPSLDQKLLYWIENECSENTGLSEQRGISIKLLLLRLALEKRGDTKELTHSVEISLQSFERADLFRGLIQLSKKGLIQFVGTSGKMMSLPEIKDLYGRFLAGSDYGAVEITPKGEQEVLRQRCLQNVPERRSLSIRSS
jgi:hypothetical protein